MKKIKKHSKIAVNAAKKYLSSAVEFFTEVSKEGEIDELAGVIDKVIIKICKKHTKQIKKLEESLHLANGTADLAIKHRDIAEGCLKTIIDVIGENYPKF